MSARWIARIAIAVWATAWSLAWATGAHAAAGQSLRQMYHTAWTVREGAPSSINEITRGPGGYLWLASNSGLFRFDGVAFERFDPPRGAKLLRRRVQVVKAMADGSLWRSYAFNGASHLSEGVNKNYDLADGLPQSAIRGFTTDAQGTVWAVANSSLLRLQGARWQQLGEAWNVHATLFSSIFTDRAGTVWVGTSAGVLYLRPGASRFESVPGLSKTVDDIEQAPGGTLWLACKEGGVWAIDPATAALKPGVAGIDVNSQGLRIAKDGSLWITTVGQGLMRLRDPEAPIATAVQPENAFERMTTHDGLSGDFAFTALQDGEGDLWIATIKGIDHFRSAALNAIDLPSGSYGISIVRGDAGGVMAAVTSLSRVAGEALVPIGGGPAKIQAAFQDPQDHVWLGARNGLWEYAGGGFVDHAMPQDMDPGVRDFQAMTEDPGGGLWVSLVNGGVYRFVDGAWTRPAAIGGLPRRSVATSMVTDDRGRIWLGYIRNRLFMVDGGTVRSYAEKDGLAMGDVTTLKPGNGGLWIGGQYGLQFFDGKAFRTLGLDDGDAFEGISGIVQTPRGDLWLNQASGVVQVEAAEIARALATAAPVAMRHRMLNRLDGLADSPIENRPLPTAMLGVDGRVYVGTRTGLFWIDPEHLDRNRMVPPVRIAAVVADGERHLEPTSVALKPNAEKIEIDYTALSLQVPERVRFRYRLEGFDRDWQEVGNRRQAFYSQLPPGRYVFHVIAANNDGVWNRDGAKLDIAVPPSFIQSTGFKLLCAVAFVVLLWLAYVMRVRQIHRQALSRLHERLAERERIARDLHDTFFQGIQALLLRFDAASARLPTQEPAKLMLDEALERSGSLMMEGRDLLHDLRQPSRADDDLPRALALEGEELAKTCPAAFALDVTGTVTALNAIVFDESLRFAKEALLNAFRHSKAEHVTVELAYSRAEFRLTVRDDGIGIPTDVMAAGFRADHWGLPGLRERARVIHAAMDMRSGPRGGTEIELRVPASVAYRRGTTQGGWFRRKGRRVA